MCLCAALWGVSGGSVLVVLVASKITYLLTQAGLCCTSILVNAVYPLSFGSTLDFFPLHSLGSSLAHYVAHGGLKLILLIQSSEC